MESKTPVDSGRKIDTWLTALAFWLACFSVGAVAAVFLDFFVERC